MSGTIILLAENHNWGLKKQDDWDKTTYTLYDSGKLFIDMYYVHEPVIERSAIITEGNMSIIKDTIKELVDSPVKCQVDACDGEAWSFKAYDDMGKAIYERDLGYIYTIEPFEIIARILSDRKEVIINDYEIIKAASNKVSTSASEVKMRISVLDYDAPYPLHFDITLDTHLFPDASSRVFEFLTYFDMLLGVEILDQTNVDNYD